MVVGNKMIVRDKMTVSAFSLFRRTKEFVVRGIQKACAPFVGDRTGQIKDNLDKACQKALKQVRKEFSESGSSVLQPGYTLEYDPETGEPFYCFHMDLPVEKKTYCITVPRPDNLSREEFEETIREMTKDIKSTS
jgi:hypothetical protein